MELVQQWANEPWFDLEHEAVEPPPLGFEKITGRMRPMCLEDPNTGARREITVEEEFHAYRKQGWKWIFRRDDYLEMLHIQAWYFQVRHFPRLSWVRIALSKSHAGLARAVLAVQSPGSVQMQFEIVGG